MALELVVETTEGMGETTAGLYVEKDGKFHLDVSGLPDVSGLTSTLAKQKQKILDSKASTATIQAKLDELEAAEVTRLEKAGKTEEADNLKYEKYKTTTDDTIAGLKGEIEILHGKSLENIFRKVAADAGVHKTAVDDVLLHGGNMFSLSAEGKAVQLGTDGQPILGADGTSNFSPAEWIKGMRVTSPHWFPADSSGGGSGGDGDGGGGQDTISRVDFDAMNPTQKMKFSRKGGKVV